MIQNYSDFCRELLAAGFSVAGGGNDEGVFGLLPHGWNDQPPDSEIRWHTGEPEHDPWEWRIRVLDERDDVAYGKLFFRKAGYITRDWYPYFLAARRGGQSFDEAYQGGTVSHFAKQIYELLRVNGALPLHILKSMGGFGKEDKAKFDGAITELQMRLFITMCGRAQKTSKTGEEYGWASTSFCTVEAFWPQEVFDRAAKITPEEAAAAITAQVYRLNPAAAEKTIAKFILGR
ncbi:MAG: hypothetical protein LBS96_09645 [Oscillospiraceae bacterium]|nr:hypothetical protein [Oscillospiraceae bacterium]